MSFNYTYRELFSIHMYHDYFLNLGIDPFFRMDKQKREKQLSQFNWSSYLDIQPTIETEKELKNQRMKIFKDHTSFKILVSVESTFPDRPVVGISPDLKLDFMVRVTDDYFAEYTTVKVSPERIFWLTNSEWRQFPLIPLFPPPFPPDPESEEETNPAIVDDAYMLRKRGTRIFKKHYKISPEDAIIGIISIQMKVSDSLYSVTRDHVYTDPENETRQLTEQLITGNQFYMWFENSKYTWGYRRKGDNNLYKTDQDLPLVKNGDITVNPDALDPEFPSGYIVRGMKLPNPQVGSLEEWEDTNNEKKIYSIIYI